MRWLTSGFWPIDSTVARGIGRIGEGAHAGADAAGERRVGRLGGLRQREIKILHVLLAAVRYGRAGFEDKNLFPREAELLGDEVARDTRADDDDVIGWIAHCPPPPETLTPKVASEAGGWLQ